MLNSFDGAAVYLASGFTDMRKSIDALATLVSQDFELDLFSNSLFVFCNKDRDKLKILSPRGYPGPQRFLALLPPIGAGKVSLA